VLALVGSKRELFDSVVDPEAQGDVVGASRKLLETLVEELAPGAAEALPALEAAAVEEGDGTAPMDIPLDEVLPASEPGVLPAVTTGATQSVRDSAIELQLQRTLERIQAAFGARIERVLGAGGGLLVVLDSVDAAADAAAQALSEPIPVAVIDPRTLASVQRLGGASPLGETRSLFEAGRPAVEPPGARLAAQAREKLRATGLLLEQGCPGPALELLVSALLAAAAARAGLELAPTSADAAVWLYGEAVPRGLLDAQQAALVQRAIGLAQAPSLPDALLRGLFDEAGVFVG
jgi:hypothetical protein